MKHTIIYALDFDGVICDSAVETGITGWKAATGIWNDMLSPLPSQELVDRFRLVRPIIETGYESILAMRLLFKGESVDAILASFTGNKAALIRESKRDVDDLKKLFGETRDVWIRHAPDEWIRMNPLFPGIAPKLKRLAERAIWYIVTTKQERFVSRILEANRIHLSSRRIFGLDRKMSKRKVLLDLLALHPHAPIHFVEDRLPTLLNVLKNDELQTIRLFFADWGYNTKQDRREAARHSIEIIDIDHFLDDGAEESHARRNLRPNQ
jgi:phosphoglycolate phosphatase-like HAD superfamily hydrolase